jgi:tetrahydrodipicolinate N-succinyltransferase
VHAPKTARLYAEDVERAQMLAAVRRESPQQLLHAALNEFVENHRSELDGAFQLVQHAVLSNDRDELRRAFVAAARGTAQDDVRRLNDLIEGSTR